MRFTITAASLITLASTALAGTAIVQNNCADPIYLTITRADQSTTQMQLAANGGYYSEPVNGQGNSFGVTKTSDYYSASTPKLIWGFSDANPTDYNTVSDVNGDLGDTWQLAASDAACGTINTYGSALNCADTNDFTLTVCV